jgi:hypothetical protein
MNLLMGLIIKDNENGLPHAFWQIPGWETKGMALQYSNSLEHPKHTTLHSAQPCMACQCGAISYVLARARTS